MSKIGSTATKVFGEFAKAATVAIRAVSTEVSALGVSAVKSYAEYEQLAGEIEMLFGAGGASSVQEYADAVGKAVSEVQDEYDMLMEAQELALSNANDAYKTAGLSMNDYMKAIISFADSLKASTGNEVEAAKAANQAVIDMSDNANKMGTDMASIQNAYQGFAKQNYTMLDNLKLGYGGTKEEMQRLLDDAVKLSGIKYDISSLSDVYDAIHVIQTELGITGTTAFEAGTTISGSVNAMKAAWSNLVVGIADDTQDFDTLVDNFVESAMTAGENILPGIETSINGFGELIDSLLPVIMERVPAIINDVLPGLVQSGINMISALVDGIEQNLPQIMESAGGIIDQLLAALLEMAPQLVECSVQFIDTLVQGIFDNLPKLVEAAGEIAGAVLEGIGDLCPALEPVTDVIQVLIDNFDDVLAVLIPLTAAFVTWKTAVSIAGIIQSFAKEMDGMSASQYAAKVAQDLLNASMLANPIVLIVTLIAALVAAFVYLWNTNEEFRQFWIGLWENIREVVTTAIDAVVSFFTETIPQFIENVLAWFMELPDRLAEWGASVKDTVSNAVSEMIDNVITFFSELPENIMYWLGFILMSIILWGVDLINWVMTNIPVFVETIVTFISELPGKIGEFLGQVVTSVISWKNNLITTAVEVGSNFINSVIDYIKTLPSEIGAFLVETIEKAVSFATDMKNEAIEAGKGFFENIVSALADLPGKMGEIGADIVSGIWNGISSGWNWLVDQVKNLADSLFRGAKDALDIHSPSKKFRYLGEMCVAGFDDGMEDLMNTDVMTRNINASMSSIQANMSGMGATGGAGGFGGFQQIVNVNQQISTPDELARVMRIENRYGLMRGVPVG